MSLTSISSLRRSSVMPASVITAARIVIALRGLTMPPEPLEQPWSIRGHSTPLRGYLISVPAACPMVAIENAAAIPDRSGEVER